MGGQPLFEHAARAVEAHTLAPVGLSGEDHVPRGDRVFIWRLRSADQVNVPEAVLRGLGVSPGDQTGRSAGAGRTEAGGEDGQQAPALRKGGDPHRGGFEGQLPQFRLR